MKGANSRWPDGRRRCDGVSETEGRRCFDQGLYKVEPDVAPLRYCRRHARTQAKAMHAAAVPA